MSGGVSTCRARSCCSQRSVIGYGLLIAQQLAQVLPSAEQMDLDGGCRDTHALRDIFHWQVDEVVQDHGSPLLGREPADPRQDLNRRYIRWVSGLVLAFAAFPVALQLGGCDPECRSVEPWQRIADALAFGDRTGESLHGRVLGDVA